MKPQALDDNIHVWLGVNDALLVSHEDTKQLKSFTTFDSAINYLYLAGHKQAARQLNKLK